jgi:transcriptional regulator with XRE-family HTH domain
MKKNIYEFIGHKIRELRSNFGGKGISQEKLADEIGTTPNTISRWETSAYKPSAADLDKLSRFFGVSISVFFPHFENPKLHALLSATGDLSDDDLDDVARYIQFRKARQILEGSSKKNKKT